MFHQAQPASPRPAWRLSLKGAAVVLILAMHALGLYFLLLPARQLKQYTEVAFMTLMPPQPLPRTPPMPLPMPMPRARAITPAPAAVPAPALAPPEPAAVAAGAITEPAAEQAPAATGDLRTRALLAAGAADKAVRGAAAKDKPWLAPAELKGETAFQKLVASAYRGGPAIRLEEYLTADGRPATRVVSPGGASCFAMADNPGAGADPFKTGGKLKKVACPG